MSMISKMKTLESICLAGGMLALTSCAAGQFRVVDKAVELNGTPSTYKIEEKVEGFNFLFLNAGDLRGNTSNTLKFISKEESLANAKLLGELLKISGADVIGLAEVDYPTAKTGWVNQPLEIFKEMGELFNFLVIDEYLISPLWSTGGAMISSYRLKTVHRHLYGEDGEFLKSRLDYFFKDFIHVEGEIGTKKVNFILTHFDDGENEFGFRRNEQVKIYADYIRKFKHQNPESIIVAAGDYNDGKDSKTMSILLSTGVLFPPKGGFGTKTYQNGNPTRDLTHILATDNVDIEDLETFYYPHTDHLGLRAYIRFKD